MLKPWQFKLGLVGLLAMLLVGSGQYQQHVASTVAVQAEIPEDALRLRILAHSDRPEDQWLKQMVQEEVTRLVGEWVEKTETLAEARKIVNASLADLQEAVNDVVREAGFQYAVQVEYGDIPFPTKLYGNQLYPAGEYEGVLITLGAGQGANWWCVLFPPLCFVDFGSGAALNETDSADDQNKRHDPVDKAEGDDQLSEGNHEGDQVEVRFFFVELFEKVKRLFV